MLALPRRAARAVGAIEARRYGWLGYPAVQERVTLVAPPAEEAAAPTTSPERRRRVIVAVVHAVIAVPLIVQAVYHPDRWTGPDDFTTHLRAALPETWRKPWVPGPPHFVWHTLVKVSSWVLPGRGYLLGAVLVSVAFAAATGVVWYEVLRLRGASGTRMSARWAAIGSVVLVCMEAPSSLQGWATIITPRLWLPLHAYHGPTGTAARPFVALLVLGFVRMATTRPDDPVHRATARWLPWVAVIACLTKPTMSVDLVAITPVVGWWWARQDGRSVRDVVGPVLHRFVVPTIGIVCLQYTVMAFQVPPKYRQETIIEPFRVIIRYQLWQPRFWSVLLLPAAMIAFWGRRLLADRLVQATVLSFGVGLVLLVLMSSSNPGRDALAALWFLVHPVALFLLFGARRVAELVRTDPRPNDRRGIAVCSALVVLYVFAWAEFTSCQLGQACLTG